MRRTLTPLLVLLVLVAALSSAADAKPKPKHKPQPRPVVVERGSYDLQLAPNPGYYATDAQQKWCSSLTTAHVGRVPDSWDYHGFRFPPPGTFEVTLQPELRSFPVGPEWDLVLLASSRQVARASTKWGAYQLSYSTASPYQPLVLVACNKSGWPNATVSWTFTYR